MFTLFWAVLFSCTIVAIQKWHKLAIIPIALVLWGILRFVLFVWTNMIFFVLFIFTIAILALFVYSRRMDPVDMHDLND